MSKTLKKKKHWSSKVQECSVSWTNDGEFGTMVDIQGGAESGEFPNLGPVVSEAMVCHIGRFPSLGDVLLEVNGTPVSGLTNRDTLAVIRHFREPIRLKTVKPGKVLNTDLRHYLSLQFQKGSLDHKLQQVIRDNLYLRTIPCTTRQPREGEVPGVDYNFISVGEFRVLEESGLLLESGTYDGNYYGTPKPPAEPSPVQPDPVDQVLFDEEFDTEVQRKRTPSVSKMDRKDSAAPEEEEEEEQQRPALVNGVNEHPDPDASEWRKSVPSYSQSASAMDPQAWAALSRDESQDPLPKNMEMAYTETGMVYFIDHNSKTTTWLDPRLAKKAKPPEKGDDGGERMAAHQPVVDLPYGWEKIEDPQYGSYYVDHINQKTQFENPVLEAKKKATVDTPPSSQLTPATPPEEAGRALAGRVFTRDPAQLQGNVLRTALRKSPLGFGFTIIGGDRPDEFLQVKNVLADGPAAHDNKIASGDVIVDINGLCVLGKTHADVVQMFQCIPINQYVDLVLCRGYPLPADTGSGSDASAEAKDPSQTPSPTARPDPHHDVPDGGVTLPRQGAAVANGGRHHHQHHHHHHQHHPPQQPAHHPQGHHHQHHPQPPQAAPDPTLLQPELIGVPLVKGPGGFGFAIADCPLGQKVKMILDAQWCRGLLKGDVIKEINRQNVQTLSHAQVVDILKELAVGSEVSVLVLRGGHTSPVKSLKPAMTQHPVVQAAPHPSAQPLPQPGAPSGGQHRPTERQDMTASTETLSPVEPPPQPLPYSSSGTLLRSASPKPDASELYLRSRAMLESQPLNTKDLDVFIKRNQESGFGFRVLGGEGPDQPVYIGAIVPLGAAEKDGRLRAGDELLCIDGVPVKGKSHKQVLDLMTNAARNGQVLLTVRRKVAHADVVGPEEGGPQPALALVNGSPRLPRVLEAGSLPPPPPSAQQHARPECFDITLHRKDNEGFGFVILTSKNKPPPGVIPHKIGRIIEGSPTDRTGQMKVGDRISAVNGRSIMDLSHNDIVQLIKEAGNSVTLTVVPEDDSGPPSGASSAKQSPSAQHRVIGPQANVHTDRNGHGEDRREYKTLPSRETPGTKQGCFVVELERGQRGFGFSLRGGKEYNMGLFILRLAEEGPALRDGRIHVGDQIVEINGEATQGITHTRAIELIQAGGHRVHLLMRPGQGLVPDHSSKDKTTIPTSGFARLSVSDEHPSPASPPSAPETYPFPPNTTPTPTPSPDDTLGVGAPERGGSTKPARGRPHQKHPSSHSGPDQHPPHLDLPHPDQATGPAREGPGWGDRSEPAPHSPREAERGGYDGSPEDRSREKQTHRPSSSSPRKSSGRGEPQQDEAGGLHRSPEEPHSPRRPAGQEPRERRGRGEEERGEAPIQGTAERRKRDGGGPASNGPAQREPDHSSLGRRGGRQKERERQADQEGQPPPGPAEEAGRRDPRGSSSSLQDPVYSGTSGTKKAAITPGPWKVPSTSKIQSHGETAHEGF
ncbi:membrane-associated guanylate kinase, WW and PDZ domain-containing protein 3a isoform X1 [Gadus morhua]|uniref:membrane-associated guanylate kinase, WW and PDZ domain-containing protein 3a isoform X1 n=1 Tax=Gadus morhua TaxID=8049 RepID=UPI0011B62621|nr:membrane-associated guanylate kinase, WW and PDZ domain-containing protein 3-like isoform X1 [Gadus morhua]